MLQRIIVFFPFYLCYVSAHTNENAKLKDTLENPADSTTTVTGNIYDALTGRLLSGADIAIKETAFGTASDDNGKYIIESLPVGTYILTVSYVGYQTAERSVDVTDPNKNNVNIELYPVVIKGKPIEITAQAEGQLKAINRQLSAKAIVNHVSASRIEELPDANAATFVTLDIFDVSGRIISTLVHEKQNTGMYTVTFNATEFPSAVYFYRLNTSSGQSRVRKMVLLK